jgi:hypothetical protein
MSQGAFVPPVGTPQQLFGQKTGELSSRVGTLEQGRTPKRFELVSDILMPVVAGDATWMMAPRDISQFRLIDFAAGVYEVSSTDITVMIVSQVWGDLLSAPMTILATEQNTYPAVPSIIPGQPIFVGDRITFTVIDPGTGATGLAFMADFG